MRKTYAAPTLVSSGHAVNETRNDKDVGSEPQNIPLTAGRVGFYL
jgi:hypothetical protein